MQFQQQPADDPDVVKHIIEREVQGETKTLKEEFAFTTELRVSVQTKAQYDKLEAKMRDLLNNAPENVPIQLWQTAVDRYVIQPWVEGNINPFCKAEAIQALVGLLNPSTDFPTVHPKDPRQKEPTSKRQRETEVSQTAASSHSNPVITEMGSNPSEKRMRIKCTWTTEPIRYVW